jgi:hypothetical protein
MLHNSDNVCSISHGEFEKDEKMVMDVINKKANSYSCNICLKLYDASHDKELIQYLSLYCFKISFLGGEILYINKGLCP